MDFCVLNYLIIFKKSITVFFQGSSKIKVGPISKVTPKFRIIQPGEIMTVFQA